MQPFGWVAFAQAQFEWSIWVSCIAAGALAFFMGYMDDRLGLLRAEWSHMSERNPQVMETLEIVRRLEKRIDVYEKNTAGNTAR